MRKVILASASPRRKELLDQAGIDHIVIASDVDENANEESAEELVKALSKLKAEAVFEEVSDQYDMQEYVVIGADTVVCCDEKVLGKPENYSQAQNMLRLLSDREHSVYTGVCIVGKSADGEKFSYVFASKTDVIMQKLDDEIIEWYIGTGEPMDKAGAYGIQGYGAVLVKSIKGDYNNVVGLPLTQVWQLLYRLG